MRLVEESDVMIEDNINGVDVAAQPVHYEFRQQNFIVIFEKLSLFVDFQRPS